MKNFKLYAYREEIDLINFIEKFETLEQATQYININSDEEYEGCELVLHNKIKDETFILFDYWEELELSVKNHFKKLFNKIYGGNHV